MGKNLNNNQTPSNCIIISKSGDMKEVYISDDSEMNRTKYAALCKTPPTYESAFKRYARWNVKKYGIVVELWARANGRAGQENKYEFPPPVDETLFFGDCVLVSINAPITCSVWKKAHAHLFGGFDDLEKLAPEDDAEYDELEHVSTKKKTKHGYLKDGFIIDDAPRAKRAVKMTMGSDTDNAECKPICDKAIVDLLRRKCNAKKHNDDDGVDNDDDEDDDDDENDDDDDDDEEHDNNDDDDDDENDDDDVGADDDESVDDDEGADDDDGVDDDDDEGGDGNRNDRVPPNGMVNENVIVTEKTQISQTKVNNSTKTTTNQTVCQVTKKRQGARVNNGRKRSAATHIIKRDSHSHAGAIKNVHDDDIGLKMMNLDSELEEELYV